MRMGATSEFLRAAEADSWKEFPDFKGSSKKVGRYRIELLGGTDRGGLINIWEKEKSSLPHVWTPSDNNEWKKLDQVNFVYFLNAEAEYRYLKNEGDVLYLMTRNG